MEWTRSTPMRVIALVASLALVAVHWSDRGVWLWVGVALSVLNVVAAWRAGRGPPPPADELRVQNGPATGRTSPPRRTAGPTVSTSFSPCPAWPPRSPRVRPSGAR